MRRTDYSAIATVFDDNQARLRIPPDALLGELLDAPREGDRGRLAGPRLDRAFEVLDVGCGTGNYLAVQAQAFAGRGVAFSGVDPSDAMLAKARAKLTGVALSIGRAEALPYEAERFDYVTSSFAFHHFEDKGRALDELVRVLRRGGGLRIANLAPSLMTGWWLYRYFPEAGLEDEKRFWSPALLLHELSARGLVARANVEIAIEHVPLTQVLTDALRRDTSELVILDEATYQRGVDRIRAELERDAAASVPSELALARWSARRPG